MSLSDLYFVNPKLDQATPKDIAAVEKALRLRLPKSYVDFVRKFGGGALCGRIRVYHPRTLVKDCREFRERVAEYFLWNESDETLTKQQVLESVPVADTFDGDELIFHPSDPATIYLLPRGEDDIRKLGSNIEEAFSNVFQWCGEKHARWHFDSEVGSQVLQLARIKKRPNLVKTKEALLTLEPAALVVEQESRGDISVVVFLESISGDVILEGTKTSFSAMISHACASDSKAVQAVLACLQKQGFVLPFVSDGVPHPEIQKLVETYFPMKGLVPSPVAVANRSAADVVMGFVAATNRWELGMTAWFDADLPPGPPNPIASSVVAEFCAPVSGRTLKTFSKPPDFDPEKESIIDSDFKSDKQAIVRSKREGSFPVEREFRLKKTKNGWRIESIWISSITFGQKGKAERWL